MSFALIESSSFCFSSSVVKKMYSYKSTLLPPSAENRFRGLGKMNSKVGRDCELKVIEWLQNHCEVVMDMNIENPTALYDIHTELHGRINVKAITGNGRWRFPKADNCDFVCCVGLYRGRMMFAALVHPQHLPQTLTMDSLHPFQKIVFERKIFL